MPRESAELLQGTLGLLILKALAGEDRHGYAIARWVETVTGDLLRIEEGSLYPALRRLEDRKWVRSSWGTSETNRRVRIYALTAAGRRHLEQDARAWNRFARAVALVLSAEPALG